MVRFGCELVQKWRAFQEADERIREHTVQLNDHCIRLDEQTKVLGVVWHNLNARHQLHFHDVTQMLKRSLQAASDSLSGAEQRRQRRFQRLRRSVSSEAVRYTFVYETIEDAVRKLDSWHTRFDQVFFLLTRIGGIDVDSAQLIQQTAPGQPAQRLRRMRRVIQGTTSASQCRWLPPTTGYSNQGVIQYSSVPRALHDSQQVLVDTLIPDSHAELDRTSSSIYNLSEILKQSDASVFGLLSCKGVLYQPPSSATGHMPRYNMLFTVPSGLQKPASLRSLLIRKKDTDFSVNELLTLAIGLAKSLVFVHSSRFVHKNIRPETVVVFASRESRLGKCFVMGFEQFRPVDG